MGGSRDVCRAKSSIFSTRENIMEKKRIRVEEARTLSSTPVYFVSPLKIRL